MKDGGLTNQDYWVDYYSQSSEDKRIIEKTCGHYDAIWQKMIASASQKSESIVEIGAFPGRYLAYLAATYNLRPTGIDFNPDGEKVARTMQVMGVKDFDYVVGDFLKTKPTGQYDLVISNGFIEHFDDFNKVMDLHVPYLKPGGSMVIMVPNKRYFRYLYGLFMDYQNLTIHNLKCMNKSVFIDFAKRNKLEIVDIHYFGGFAYKVHQPLGKFRDLIFRACIKIFRRLNPLLARYPNRLWSSSLIAIYHKPLNDGNE